MTSVAITAVGVVVPVHDEHARLGGCLASVWAAAAHPELRGIEVVTAVVLDACTDGSARVAAAAPRSMRQRLVSIGARNVGMARRAGTAAVLIDLAAHSPATTWLATTDADTRVRSDWLARQLRLAAAGYQGVAGTIDIADWPGISRRGQRAYRAVLAGRRRPGGRHDHVYGANLGVRADAYLAVGGFPALRLAEDVALWKALELTGRPTVRSSSLVVATSGRAHGRAPGGLSSLLTRLDRP